MRIHELSATALRERLESGALSSRDIVEALLERADAVDLSVNALVHRFDEEALDRARRADRARGRGELRGPLHGLPITVKECLDTRGVATTLGIRARRDRVAAKDAVVVRAARGAGAIVLGKTNVPQTLASPIYTVNAIWGRTNNPWSLAHGPGGSSGGEAAALAGGMSVLGLATDIGGSIRIPASFCGVCGLKPTTGRWSNVGSRGLLGGLGVARSQTGALARTTADLALLFDALTGPLQTARDLAVPPLPAPGAGAAARAGSGTAGPAGPGAAPGAPEGLEGLRVGRYEHDGFLAPAASMARGVREAARALEERGAEVVPYEPPYPAEAAYLLFDAATVDAGQRIRGALQGEEPIGPLRDLLRLARLPGLLQRGLAAWLRRAGEPRVARLVESLQERSAGEFRELVQLGQAIQREELRRWREEELDAVLCPAFATPAAPHGVADDFTLGISYTVRFNLTHMPAGSVPVGRVAPGETSRAETTDRLDRRAAEIEAASEGLPVGVQVVGRPWREDEGYPETPVDPPEATAG